MDIAQEAFWQGAFGDEYTARNADTSHVAGQVEFFCRILGGRPVTSALELGANVGHNLMALRQIRPDARFSAVEINQEAIRQLYQNVPWVSVHARSILDWKPDPAWTWDLVFTYGVLIHLPPDRLPEVYDLMYQTSARYVLMAEYYNPIPVEVPYRGHRGKLFKRDFAGEMLDRYPDLRLLDYGFQYHRDAISPGDDVTWFLLSK